MSPWHDIPLRPLDTPKDVVNFVCEIPRGTRAKFEINTAAKYNPIIQDRTKAGEPRCVCVLLRCWEFSQV